MPRPDAILLFSGGRDSTLACLRMVRAGRLPVLVTVTSQHLIGLPVVRRRLEEMRSHLPPGTLWVNVQQPDLSAAFPGALPTCLPCHLGYVVAGAQLARRHGASILALGYTSYQGTWAEQTSVAIDVLTGALRQAGLTLSLPVHDLTSKATAIAELRDLGLTTDALEQKCLQQQHNLPLAHEPLAAETARWGSALRAALDDLDSVSLPLLHQETL